MHDWTQSNLSLGLMNQITSVPNTGLSFDYNYIRSTFAPLDSIKESIVPRNYKLLKRNRYLKLR